MHHRRTALDRQVTQHAPVSGLGTGESREATRREECAAQHGQRMYHDLDPRVLERRSQFAALG